MMALNTIMMAIMMALDCHHPINIYMHAAINGLCGDE